MKITHEVQISELDDGFTNSRGALAKLLNQENISITDLKTDLELLNYQHLKNYPGFTLSLSHTKGAGAAVLSKASGILSLGIDIEWQERHLKDEAARFYRHPEDSHYEDKLELWTMKEAAFKALSPRGFPGVLVLSKIIIKEGSFYTNERPEIRGRVETYLKKVDNKNQDEVFKRIEEVLELKIRPAVAMDGGNISLRSFIDGVAEVELQGSCAGCPSSTLTLKQGVERMLVHYVPEVKSVRAVSL